MVDWASIVKLDQLSCRHLSVTLAARRHTAAPAPAQLSRQLPAHPSLRAPTTVKNITTTS